MRSGVTTLKPGCFISPPAGLKTSASTIVLSRLHPDDLDWVVQASRKCFKEGAEFRNDYRIVLRDGSIRWFQVLAKAFVTPSDKPNGMTGLSLDITDRKKADQEIVWGV